VDLGVPLATFVKREAARDFLGYCAATVTQFIVLWIAAIWNELWAKLGTQQSHLLSEILDRAATTRMFGDFLAAV
jgi:hypothetical protein